VILANAQWQRLEPLIQAARSSGRPRQTDMRAAMNAIFYLLRNRHLVGLRPCA
jgi:transposase